MVLVVGMASLALLVRARHDGPGAARRRAEHAFYFWRTRFAPSATEARALGAIGATRLYVRLFDVVWDEARHAARPDAPLQVAAPVPPGIAVVPVVYLTNEVFVNTAYADVEALADAVWAKAEAVSAQLGVHPDELQIDSDWTQASRRAYFRFADLLHQRAAAAHRALSATLRLHQVKYATRTGVPPVDRGMVMFYNFGRIEADAARSSIFNADDARRYASYLAAYPLPLDLSLPMFSWMVHSRDGQVRGLLEKVGPDEVEATGAFRARALRQYEATRALFFRGRYFMAGDRLLVEETGPDEALEAARLAGAGARGKGFGRVALFELDDRNLGRFPPATLRRILAEVD